MQNSKDAVTDVKALLKRVAALERARMGPRSPIELAYGSFGAFEAEVQAGIGTGRFDSRDMPVVLEALASWHRNPLVWGQRLPETGTRLGARCWARDMPPATRHSVVFLVNPTGAASGRAPLSRLTT